MILRIFKIHGIAFYVGYKVVKIRNPEFGSIYYFWWYLVIWTDGAPQLYDYVLFSHHQFHQRKSNWSVASIATFDDKSTGSALVINESYCLLRSRKINWHWTLLGIQRYGSGPSWKLVIRLNDPQQTRAYKCIKYLSRPTFKSIKRVIFSNCSSFVLFT